MDDIRKICKKYGIYDYTINNDGSIDVNGSVDLTHNRLKKLPLKFNYIGGNFNCSYNNLTTLEGSPKQVDGYFDCENNDLTSLE